MSVSEASIHSLPNENHFQVLGYLDSQSIEVSGRVWVRWRDIIQDPSFRLNKENELNTEYSAKLQKLVNCICLLPQCLARIPDISDYGLWRSYAINHKDENILLDYDSTLKEFYLAFKEKTIFKHHYIDSHEFMSSAKEVTQELYLVSVSYFETSNLSLDVLSNQIECCYRSFYAKAFKDLMLTCASHFNIVPSQNIFYQQIEFLKTYCTCDYIDNVYNSLPDIVIKTDSLEHADDLLKYKFKETISHEKCIYRQQLKTTIVELEKERAFLNKRLLELRGTNGFNGEIDAAFKKGDFIIYNELVSQLQSLAQFDNNGNIIGGKFFDLSQQIIKLKSEYEEIPGDEFLKY